MPQPPSGQDAQRMTRALYEIAKELGKVSVELIKVRNALRETNRSLMKLQQDVNVVNLYSGQSPEPYDSYEEETPNGGQPDSES